MTLRVAMAPGPQGVGQGGVGGIRTVVEHYARYLPHHDIEVVDLGVDSYDVLAVHAGAVGGVQPGPLVAHCHGLYWSTSYTPTRDEHQINASVVRDLRHAQAVTVPSEWVAQTLRRDLHLNPTVVPHGVEMAPWMGGDPQGYVLWNKNRAADACDPTPVIELAERARNRLFLTTFGDRPDLLNLKTTGQVDHATMRDMVRGASVYLATAKETFGIGTLEAMAAGLPILGYDHGGTRELVKHGYNGYLVPPGDYDALVRGLDYCFKYRDRLGRNGQRIAETYTWSQAAGMAAHVYRQAYASQRRRPTIAVVIPCYNKRSTLLRAVRSAVRQTHKPNEIWVIDNNSTEDLSAVVAECEALAVEAKIKFGYANCVTQGVAHARNYGIRAAEAEYLCCLDADDEIEPGFLGACLATLESDPSLGLAYTKLTVIEPDGSEIKGEWPDVYRYDNFLRKHNQVPTCCVFRRSAWLRTGGYRQRYAPHGAGSEDADFWCRMGALGLGGKLATDEALFRYYLGGQVSGNPHYEEVYWLDDKPWVIDRQHPLASCATPLNGVAHAAREYDEPAVTVVVACAAHHVGLLVDALDSIEGQAFRFWECVVVLDFPARQREPMETIDFLKEAYPYVKFVHTAREASGAGAARNLGAQHATAPLLLFLDADDWLAPEALESLLDAYDANPDQIIYSDYHGYAYLDDGDLLTRMQHDGRLVHYDPKRQLATIRHTAQEYDCARAVVQPVRDQEPYIWSVISSLTPKRFHEEIGGFDEEMASWEDWDYWIRMARAGKCFARVARPLLHYRFYSGTRRKAANPGETGIMGRQLSSKLLQYIRSKYDREGTDAMAGCRSCGGGRSKTQSPPASTLFRSESIMPAGTSDDMVMVELSDGNVGDHLIAVQGTSYGYKAHGDRFLMRRDHAALSPQKFRVVSDYQTARKAAAPAAPAPEPPPPPDDGAPQEVAATPQEPAPAPSGFDFASLWGIDEERAETLRNAGVRTLDGLIAMGDVGLKNTLGVTDQVAARILKEALAAND